MYRNVHDLALVAVICRYSPPPSGYMPRLLARDTASAFSRPISRAMLPALLRPTSRSTNRWRIGPVAVEQLKAKHRQIQTLAPRFHDVANAAERHRKLFDRRPVRHPTRLALRVGGHAPERVGCLPK